MLGGRAAWDLVIGALADEKGEVADEAQLRLAALDEPKLLRHLLGRRALRWYADVRIYGLGYRTVCLSFSDISDSLIPVSMPLALGRHL